MKPLEGDDRPLASVIALIAAYLAICQLTGMVDLAQVTWTQLGLGAAAFAASGLGRGINEVNRLTDRLDVTEPAAPGVALVRRGDGASAWRSVRWTLGISAVALGGTALLYWAEGGVVTGWAVIFAGLGAATGVRALVARRLVLAHGRENDVRVLQPEDPDDWFERATGRDLDEGDPGPLFHQSRRG